jgi:hypothetical protein
LDYDMAAAFDMHATLMQLYVNEAIPAPMSTPAAFETALPPQHTVELLVECL